jgi:hypothetical protein
MKRILLGALLLLSMSTFAQDAFVKKYTSYITKSKGVLQPWVTTEVTVVFNADNVKDIVLYYTDGRIKRLHQITGSKDGKTLNGDGYQIIDCIDEKGAEITLQLFDDDKCLRLIIADGYLIEFHK